MADNRRHLLPGEADTRAWLAARNLRPTLPQSPPDPSLLPYGHPRASVVIEPDLTEWCPSC